MKAKLIDPANVDWAKLDQFADRTVFQTREWLQFVHETQRARIVICEVIDAGQVAGYFTGLVFSKFGIRMLGRSFPGWTTPYIGFTLVPGASRQAALVSLDEIPSGPLTFPHTEP